jgi:Tetratricopeptide repeat
MSYINDALRKAQREKDDRCERYGGVISPCPEGSGQPRKRRLTIGAAVTLFVLIPAGVLLTVSILHQPSLVTKGTPQPVVTGNPAATQSANPQTAKETTAGNTVSEAVPADAAPAWPQVEKATAPGGGAPAAIPAGGKPIPFVAAVLPGGTPVLRKAETLYQEALSAQRRGDVREAEAIYKKVLALDPGHIRALNNLGVICMGQKKRERAIALFSKAIVLKRDYVDPYYNLACLYAQTNEIDESLWYLKVAITINGDVKNWVQKDADMKNVVASSAFKKIMEGQKN